MVSDTMYWFGRTYLVSITIPLYLLISIPAGTKTNIQGKAMMGHIKLLENRGFPCNKVIVDSERGLVGLVNRIPGVEIDVVGAGDHLPLVDIQIQRLKEMCRAIVSGLPFTLPCNRIDDVVAYSVNRKKHTSNKIVER